MYKMFLKLVRGELCEKRSSTYLYVHSCLNAQVKKA